ncbi:energy-coupling factor transporter transmembrane component T family protein [Desmospora profundinema]|uniref:Energy-coupling factor transporter transmembrane protein EcfT n=1 Tax=Desmospora profundinema TaxID=1571184 RepID=A0ABU1IQ65_9BACL|nr:energy-coupling factor transporter transmembrane component T [Desmospora profundinema]MDR6226925.1 energy-coupling factor transport system permease protein [Desmospora profundinema]
MSALQNPILGQYVPGDSPLHRMDPRAKLIYVFLFMMIVFLANNSWTYGLLVAVTGTGILLSGVPLVMVWRGLKPILFLIAFTAGLHLWMTRGGEVWVDWGWLTIHEEGVIQAVKIALRFLLLVITGTLLTLTTSPIDLTDGLEQLLSPFTRIGVPAHELALMMSIALRFIPTLWEETDKIIKAQKARGAAFESGSVWKRVKGFVPILIPLFVSAFRRAEELAWAMEARGYRGGVGRTKLRELQYTRLDYALWALLAVIIVALVGLRDG